MGTKTITKTTPRLISRTNGDLSKLILIENNSDFILYKYVKLLIWYIHDQNRYQLVPIWMLVFFIIMAVVLTLQKRFELSYLVIWIPILVLIGVGTIFRYSFYQDFYTRTQLYFGIFKGKEKKMNYDSIKCLEIRYLGYGREKPSITVHYSEKKIKSKWRN
jgi:hypothetical protein